MVVRQNSRGALPRRQPEGRRLPISLGMFGVIAAHAGLDAGAE